MEFTSLAVSYDNGKVPSVTTPGSFFLTHRHDFWSRCIRFGEGLRLSKETRQYAFWNHTGIFVDDKGGMVEALGKGVCLDNISKYKDEEFTIVTVTGVDSIDVDHAIKFANWSIGEEYGFLTITAVALWSLFGGKFLIGLDGTEICSALVARCLERYGLIFDKNPLRMTPSDLAEFFQVQIPK